QDDFDLYNEAIANSPDFIGEVKMRELELQVAGRSSDLGDDPLVEETVKAIGGDITVQEALQNALDLLNEAIDWSYVCQHPHPSSAERNHGEKTARRSRSHVPPSRLHTFLPVLRGARSARALLFLHRLQGVWHTRIHRAR